MIHLRVVSPPDRTDQVLELLMRDDAVCNVVRLPGASRRPDGDVVLADVAREDASVVIAELRSLRIDEDGSIAVERIDTAIGRHARRAIARAPGEEADAVVWEEVENRTQEESSLSWTYLAFMLLAAGIAVSGIFTQSAILIVGAMVVSPDFGPLAGVCVALVQFRRGLWLRSSLAIVGGFTAAILLAWALSEALIAAGVADRSFDTTAGIGHLLASPDAFTWIVAVCAGAAGMLSLTTAKSGALIGVLISVTTIPAAAEIGVAASLSDWGDVRGAAIQLAANISTIIVVGTATLWVQRLSYHRRRRQHAEQRADPSLSSRAAAAAAPSRTRLRAGSSQATRAPGEEDRPAGTTRPATRNDGRP